MMKHFSADIAPAREEHRAHPILTAKAGLPTLLDACFTNLTQAADDNDAATNAPLLQVIAPPGRNCSVQYSSNLVQWAEMTNYANHRSNLRWLPSMALP